MASLAQDTMIPPVAAAPFLAAAGWGDAQISPLAGDASFRRYFRVTAPGRRAVLMDAPPPHEDPRPFVEVARYLQAHGFAAPAILAADVEQGLVLLEDFGDARMAEVIAETPALEEGVYARAVDLLLDLASKPAMPGLAPYDMAVCMREVGLFTEWYAPALSLEVDQAGFEAAWRAVLAPVASQGTATVLRDYHAENIMLLPDSRRSHGLGLLDFQDALAGHPAYDLVSLLQDARRDVSPAVEQAMLARYRDRTQSSSDFAAAYAVLGAQRNAKIIGIFTRLWKRDSKPRYLEFLPRMWGLLERDLAHPALAPVAEWFAQNVPAEARGELTMGARYA